MTRRQFPDRLLNDQFVRHVGIEPVFDATSPYWTKLDLEERHLNGNGFVQGGCLFTVADYAFALASNMGGRNAVALDTTMSFVKAVSEGTLYARVQETSLRRRVALYHITVETGEGALVAVFQGTAYILNADG